MILDTSASAAIGIYQRYISPHKGFCCAYRVHTGKRSCSAYAQGIVERVGALALFTAMPRQFARCKEAYMALSEAKNRKRLFKNKENESSSWGDCDVIDCTDIPCDWDFPCDCSW